MQGVGSGEVALTAGEVRALQVAGRAAPEHDVLGSVVAGEHDERVVRDPELVEEVEKHTEVAVELKQAVSPVALSGLALELLARDHRHVHQRMIEVDKERRSSRDGASDEVIRVREVCDVAVAPDLECQLLALGDVWLALLDLYHPRLRVALWVIPRVGRP